MLRHFVPRVFQDLEQLRHSPKLIQLQQLHRFQEHLKSHIGKSEYQTQADIILKRATELCTFYLQEPIENDLNYPLVVTPNDVQTIAIAIEILAKATVFPFSAVTSPISAVVLFLTSMVLTFTDQLPLPLPSEIFLKVEVIALGIAGLMSLYMILGNRTTGVVELMHDLQRSSRLLRESLPGKAARRKETGLKLQNALDKELRNWQAEMRKHRTSLLVSMEQQDWDEGLGPDGGHVDASSTSGISVVAR